MNKECLEVSRLSLVLHFYGRWLIIPIPIHEVCFKIEMPVASYVHLQLIRKKTLFLAQEVFSFREIWCHSQMIDLIDIKRH